ncbi:MAG: hypothetical protein A2X58_03480 [Nitrospirae bacterium GWC2_56_14]|nr:MAG: hypothetical protein A2X58_03480 [Nitrospirae bacterium GWC2_56_14]
MIKLFASFFLPVECSIRSFPDRYFQYERVRDKTSSFPSECIGKDLLLSGALIRETPEGILNDLELLAHDRVCRTAFTGERTLQVQLLLPEPAEMFRNAVGE